jgi:hypothetical protein
MKKTKTIRGWIADEGLVTQSSSFKTLFGDLVYIRKPKIYGTFLNAVDAYLEGRQTGRVFRNKTDAIAAGFSNPQRVEITVKLV